MCHKHTACTCLNSGFKRKQVVFAYALGSFVVINSALMTVTAYTAISGKML